MLQDVYADPAAVGDVHMIYPTVAGQYECAYA